MLKEASCARSVFLCDKFPQRILTSPHLLATCLIVVTKIPEGASREGLFGLTVRGDTVSYGREIMAALVGDIWSHHLHSQEAESEQEVQQL